MLKPHELRKLRSGYITSAEENVSNFVKENKAILPQLVETLIYNLKTKNISGAQTISYELLSSAKSFGRGDLSNIADILSKALKKEIYHGDETLKLFGKAFTVLFKKPVYDPDLEKVITKSIFEHLRKMSK